VAKVLCVLYDDPVDGYPPKYARDGVPEIAGYHGGQTTPTPQAIDFTPGELLGSVSGELGLRTFVEGRGHELIVTSDKDGPDSAFERELTDAEIVISQPFWPAYLTAERIAKAPNLKLAVTRTSWYGRSVTTNPGEPGADPSLTSYLRAVPITGWNFLVTGRSVPSSG
jgi:formate dehydrogenase